MDQLTDTQDLTDVGVPHPAEHGLPASEVEATIRHRGLWWTVTGSVAIGLAIIGALGLAAAVHNLTITHLLFAVLGVALIAAAGSSLLTAGLIEVTQRPTRTLIRAAMARAKVNGQTADGTRELVNELILEIRNLRRQVEDQHLTAMTMAGALDEIAGYLPENQDIHHWRGFNTAVRERLANGTSGHNERRAPHIGLVPPQKG